MRTIGRTWPSSSPTGDYQVMCDICGVHWRRTQMRRDGSGRLICPDELPGRDEVTLDRANAAHASKRKLSRRIDSGNYDHESGPGDAPHRTTAEDIEL